MALNDELKVTDGTLGNLRENYNNLIDILSKQEFKNYLYNSNLKETVDSLPFLWTFSNVASTYVQNDNTYAELPTKIVLPATNDKVSSMVRYGLKENSQYSVVITYRALDAKFKIQLVHPDTGLNYFFKPDAPESTFDTVESSELAPTTSDLVTSTLTFCTSNVTSGSVLPVQFALVNTNTTSSTIFIKEIVLMKGEIKSDNIRGENTILGCVRYNDTTGAITSFEDYDGTETGTVKAISVGHGFTGTLSLTISGTTDYNGTKTITVIDEDSFYFSATWVATQTGTWDTSYWEISQDGVVFRQIQTGAAYDFVTDPAVREVVEDYIFDVFNGTPTGVLTDTIVYPDGTKLLYYDNGDLPGAYVLQSPNAGDYLPIAGGTMTGLLILDATNDSSSNALAAASKGFVDANTARVSIGDTPPTAAQGKIHYDTDDERLLIGNGTPTPAWVEYPILNGNRYWHMYPWVDDNTLFAPFYIRSNMDTNIFKAAKNTKSMVLVAPTPYTNSTAPYYYSLFGGHFYPEISSTSYLTDEFIISGTTISGTIIGQANNFMSTVCIDGIFNIWSYTTDTLMQSDLLSIVGTTNQAISIRMEAEGLGSCKFRLRIGSSVEVYNKYLFGGQIFLSYNTCYYVNMYIHETSVKVTIKSIDSLGTGVSTGTVYTETVNFPSFNIPMNLYRYVSNAANNMAKFSIPLLRFSDIERDYGSGDLVFADYGIIKTSECVKSLPDTSLKVFAKQDNDGLIEMFFDTPPVNLTPSYPQRHRFPKAFPTKCTGVHITPVSSKVTTAANKNQFIVSNITASTFDVIPQAISLTQDTETSTEFISFNVRAFGY